ncbi:MAG: PQQ-dependent sugar dehydrogenase [Patescibacteria group bacterium]
MMIKSVPGWVWGLLGALIVLMSAVALYFWRTQPEPAAPIEQGEPTTETAASATPKLATALVVGGLTAPTVITSIPDDQRLFVAEQGGTVRIVKNNALLPTPFIDISSRVLFDGEMGLLGMAFHPDLAKGTTVVFLNYIDKNTNTTISSFELLGEDFASADPNSENVLLQFKQPYSNHNGGDLRFGPDGYLYIATGDGGSGGDPQDRAQNLGNFFGKILRIDVNNGERYKIPADNPFVATAGAKTEIWAYGLRNPWKFSFDSATSDIWIADVGQNSTEEINFSAAGKAGGLNFGWRCFEASSNHNLAGCQAKAAYTFPVTEYDHSQGRCSVTGGHVYRGQKYPSLVAQYVYADYCGGQIYAGSLVSGVWQAAFELKTNFGITAFGQGSDGEIYLADANSGSLYHLQGAN